MTSTVSGPVKRPSPRKTSTPSPLKRSRRVVAADPRADAAHALHHGGEVGLDVSADAHAEGPGRADVADDPRGADHALRGHAADVEAVAAQEMPLDERHARAEAGRARRRHQARGAGADDDQVVARRRVGLAPVGRVDVRHQLGVISIMGTHVDRHQQCRLSTCRASVLWREGSRGRSSTSRCARSQRIPAAGLPAPSGAPAYTPGGASDSGDVTPRARPSPTANTSFTASSTAAARRSPR